MSFYKIVPSSDYLSHYGVIGMKWGVRRYEKSSGQKTRSRLKKYYDAEDRYNKANKDLKAAKQSKNIDDIRKAKSEKSKAKQDMGIAYKKVKRGASYDKGREAYANGKTIIGNNILRRHATMAVLTATQIGVSYAQSKRATFTTKSGKTIKVSDLIYASSLVPIAAINAYTSKQNQNLRTYYSGG